MKPNFYRYLLPIIVDTILSMAWHIGWDESSETKIYYASMALRALVQYQFSLYASVRRWRPGKFVVLLNTWFIVACVWDIADTLTDGNITPAYAELSVFTIGVIAICLLREKFKDKAL